MPHKHQRGAVTLPKGVHRVVARGREYFYYQAGRGTNAPGPRLVLPKDAHSPDFWIALRKAQGEPLGLGIVTVDSVCDLYLASPQFCGVEKDGKREGGISSGSQDQYRISIGHIRKAWGYLPAAGLEPKHVQALVDEFADRPGTANNLLSFIRALQKWGRARGHFAHSLTEGVTGYKSEGGHVPWTPEQCEAAEKHLTGIVRRGYFLARYTGQRGSDVVRLGPTFVDDGGFRLRQQKTGKITGDIWCPIEAPLAAEMATWEVQPGPYLRLDNGKPVTKKRLEALFAEVAGRNWTKKTKSGETRETTGEITELVGTTFHGLRGTRVVELRERGAEHLEIQAAVGMSMQMIIRYCRFADRKRLAKAAVLNLAQERSRNGRL